MVCREEITTAYLNWTFEHFGFWHTMFSEKMSSYGSSCWNSYIHYIFQKHQSDHGHKWTAIKWVNVVHTATIYLKIGDQTTNYHNLSVLLKLIIIICNKCKALLYCNSLYFDLFLYFVFCICHSDALLSVCCSILEGYCLLFVFSELSDSSVALFFVFFLLMFW